MALATARIAAGPQDIITYAKARRPLPELPRCVSRPTLDLRESIIASIAIVKISNASSSNQGICHPIKSPSNGSTVNGNGRDSTRSAPAILPITRGKTNQSIAIGILSSRLSLWYREIITNCRIRIVTTAKSSSSLLLAPGPK